MKISKLFHWLYAILMFLPFGLLVFNALASMWSGNITNMTTWQDYIYDFFSGIYTDTGLWKSIFDVYEYLILNIFGIDDTVNVLTYILTGCLTYWTCISIIWLVFDVFMYVPLLVHRWIDKAKLE